MIAVARAGGLAALARYDGGAGRSVVAGLEPLWGFACPLVGPDPAAVAGAAAEALADRDWERLYLPGFPDDLDLARLVAPSLARFGPVAALPGIGRRVADISSFDRWWSTRSARFRRNLRRADAAATRAGLRYLELTRGADAPAAGPLFDRLVAIEEQSWKADLDGAEGPSGILAPDMQCFYREMIARMLPEGRCRVVVATLDGEDVGYILGGVRQNRYRGLQLSYRADAADWSVGHLLQLNEIRHLSTSGAASVYDLGMDMTYKCSWSDRLEQSVALVVERER